MLPNGAEELISLALREDLAGGDWTSQAVLPVDVEACGEVVSRAGGVIAGLQVAAAVCTAVDPSLRWQARAVDGEQVAAGQVVALLEGPARSILLVERTMLNFVQRLSGIATLTARYTTAIAGTQARLVDTRKTTPGWRTLEKAAVRAGGGHNHRMSLSDGVLIKDNHLALSGGRIETAIAQARALVPHTIKIEIEVEDLDGVRRAAEAGADIILLDNMSLEMMREAVRAVAGRALVEASGGITLERVRAVAETGVDLISCGALTHSATALDISLDIHPSSAK